MLPLFHVGGLAVLFRACLFGFTVTLLPRFDPDEVADVLTAAAPPVTLVSLVPTMLKRMLDRGWKAERIQKILSGNFLRAVELLRG